MSLPPTKAQLDAALTSPPLANALLDDIRKSITDPSVLYPEMYGAPEVARASLASFDPDTTKAADTAALTQCMTELSARGGTLLLRRPYGLTAGLVLQMTREGVRDGQRIVGTNGCYGCGLQMLSNGFNAITLQGMDGGARKPAHPSAAGFFIKGGSGTGKGIFAQNNLSGDDTNISNCVLERLLIYTGDDAVHLGECFQTTLFHVKASSHRGHSFNLDGSNTTNLYCCYASSPGIGKAGYRIIGGAPVSMYSCTGLDENSSHWALLGSLAPIAGAARSGGTTTIVRLDAGDAGYTGLYDGMQLHVTSGAQAGFRGVILRHDRADSTHGKSVTLSPDTPLPAALADGVTYNINDAESRYQNNGTAYSRDARIDMIGCNVESWERTGIKTFRRGLLTMQNMMFYQPPPPDNIVPSYDCLIYINEADSIYTSKLMSSRFDLNISRHSKYPADILQGKGSSPALMTERLDASFRNIYSMEAAASLRAMHIDPYGITLPTGFPTSNPGPGRLWSNAGVLTVGT